MKSSYDTGDFYAFKPGDQIACGEWAFGPNKI